MKHIHHDLMKRLGILFMAALMLISLMPRGQTVSAAEGGWREDIELTGDYTGIFTLNSNTSEIFNAANATPGNSWTGSITIQNKAEQPMEAALLTITSNLKDLIVYEALSLDICIAEECLYSGSYGDTPDQITPFYVIPAGKSLVLDVTIGLPESVGNEIMGKKMDSTWTFEARYPKDANRHVMSPYTVKYINKETGKSLADDKNAYGQNGTVVTEKAPDIKGYQPDASEKRITLGKTGNLIVFYYTKIENTAAATPPGNEPPGPVKTGTDHSTGNTTPVSYGMVSALCILGGIVTYLRILSAKNRNLRSTIGGVENER